MKLKQYIICALASLCTLCCANCVYIMTDGVTFGKIACPILLLLCANVIPLFAYSGPRSKILAFCLHGVVCLRTFLISLVFSVPFQIWFISRNVRLDLTLAIVSAVVCIFTLAVIFWNGIITVYVFSVQLGIKHRLLGLLFGLVPVLNIVLLVKIIRVVSAEVDFERERLLSDEKYVSRRACDTKYPVLFVHGVCFRDVAFPNYWGRIPAVLKKCGATVFYGNHGSAASIRASALELAARIRYICDDLGYGKVNVIAHSKGGLDCRYVISELGLADRFASLVTVNTPHRGCAYADFLLGKIPEKVQLKIAGTYNSVLQKLGDDEPDFLAAMRDLTESSVKALSCKLGDEKGFDGIYCISIGSKINDKKRAAFPLSLTNGFVKRFDGENDGLVSVDSFAWGGEYRFIENFSPRGISHADVIDMTRENVPGFDVREYYIKLVSELKEKGL